MARQLINPSIWHINADEPSVLDYNTEYKSVGQVISLYAADEYRSSDHNPAIVDLELASTGRYDWGSSGMHEVDAWWQPRCIGLGVMAMTIPSHTSLGRGGRVCDVPPA